MLTITIDAKLSSADVIAQVLRRAAERISKLDNADGYTLVAMEITVYVGNEEAKVTIREEA